METQKHGPLQSAFVHLVHMTCHRCNCGNLPVVGPLTAIAGSTVSYNCQVASCHLTIIAMVLNTLSRPVILLEGGCHCNRRVAPDQSLQHCRVRIWPFGQQHLTEKAFETVNESRQQSLKMGTKS